MKTETPARGVLLILPPFGSFDAPYISLAVLAGYLKSCHIPVSILDTSAFLVKKCCRSAQREAGIQAMQQTFRELNAKEQLKPSEAAQLTVIYPLLEAIIKDGPDRMPPETALQIAAFPSWPDCLVRRPFIKLISNYSIFNSDDIFQAACNDYFFTDLLRKELQRILSEAKPLIMGISAVFDEQMPVAFHCARLIKEIAPSSHVTMGGPFITTHMDELDNPVLFRLVDSLIFDEGEIPLQRLHAEMHTGAPDLRRVPGLMYLPQGGVVTKNASIQAPDMEILAFADYRACNLDQYPHPPEKMRLSIRLSRGCYWQRCSFCRVNLSFCKNYQQPSVARIFTEIQHITHTTGVRKFLFSDESSNPLILEELSRKIIDSGLAIEWSFHTRIDKKLTKERVTLYREAGCREFHVGIETFNNRLLKVLRKGITEELIEEVLTGIRGIVPIHAYMIVGIPGETEEEANQSYSITQEYIQRGLLQGAVFSLFQLMPGSDMWNTPGKYRIRSLKSRQNKDLKPNNCADFAVEDGMTRSEAFTLFIRYNYPDFGGWKQKKHVLMLAGENVPCRYPFGYLQEFLHDSLIYQNDMPFKRWLEFLDENNDPILPYTRLQ